MTQSVCVISTKTPYSGFQAREALDVALVSASYDIPTSLLLMGDAVYQLLSSQEPDQLSSKNLTAIFQSLSLYGIETINVDRESMEERGIDCDDLLPLYTILEADRVAAFLAKQDKVLNF